MAIDGSKWRKWIKFMRGNDHEWGMGRHTDGMTSIQWFNSRKMWPHQFHQCQYVQRTQQFRRWSPVICCLQSLEEFLVFGRSLLTNEDLQGRRGAITWRGPNARYDTEWSHRKITWRSDENRGRVYLLARPVTMTRAESPTRSWTMLGDLLLGSWWSMWIYMEWETKRRNGWGRVRQREQATFENPNGLAEENDKSLQYRKWIK